MQLRNSKAMFCLALSVGATTVLLPEQALASSSLLDSVGLREQINTDPATKINLQKPQSKNLRVSLHKLTKNTTETIDSRINKPILLSTSIGTQKKVKALTPTPSNHNHELIHLVKFGDTVNEIAAHYQISAAELVKVNKITNPELIEVNQRLVIPEVQRKTTDRLTSKTPKLISQLPTPGSDPHLTKLRADILRLRQEYQAQKSNNRSVELIAPRLQQPSPNTAISANLVKFKNEVLIKEQEPRLASNVPVITASVQSSSLKEPKNPTLESQEQIAVQQQSIPDLPPLLPAEEYLPESPKEMELFNGYIWPANGVFTSGYGWRWGRMHSGIDIAGPIGSPVNAAASGEVIYAGWDVYGYGNLIKVRHYDGSITVYAHNSRILVRTGEKVEQGQHISDMGSTGFSTGPHLHFEIRPYQQGPVNPLAYLP
ncbi:metalloendopeptidase-like membrane protein [Gloeocapsa sp. PCC 73106]|nr:metalloendopeptidase-like membrane protein [Gloeocapsa sp. PCC 73106]